jgi:translation initiation factor IF-2
MAATRVHELSKEMNISSKILVEQLNQLGIPAKNHMSALTEQQVKYFKNNYGKQAGNQHKSEPKEEKQAKAVIQSDSDRQQASVNKKPAEANNNYAKKKDKRSKPADKPVSGSNINQNTKNIKRQNNAKVIKKSKGSYKKEKLKRLNKEGAEQDIIIPQMITVGEFAEAIGKGSVEIIKKLMALGVMATINQEIDFDTAYIVAQEFDIEVIMEEDEDVVDRILQEHYANEDELSSRPPIVTVMGHVDHGKTSLLDAIRNTNVIAGEAGKITQHIGAYMVNLNGEDITFIDTPGHAAFTQMRSRGAKVTDIAVLVVAADDGVKPQTIEAINHAKAAQVPIIVAINKMDKPTANADRVMQELTEYGLVSENYGGDTICVPISALKNEGIEELLEMILLVAEVEELKANINKSAVGTVIEAQLDAQRGTIATMLVESGTLQLGDIVVSGSIYGKIKAMSNEKGQKLDIAGPSCPAEVMGFGEVPVAGDKFYVVSNEKEARKITQSRINRQKTDAQKKSAPISLEDLFSKIQQGNLKEINILLKADVHGSLEAIKASLLKLSNENVKINIIHGAVGGITETDVTLAAASNALILGFNVRPDTNAKKLSAKENVDIRTYRIIYELIEDIQAAMEGMLDPEFKEVATGTAEVRQIFRVPNIGAIAGCYIVDGAINRNEKVRVIRDGIVLAESTITSLKRFKDDVKEVASGYECGIGIDKFNDFKEGDLIEGFKMVEIERV